ncbi:tRNA 4-thiouridine(8) synthase ThiI [Clostridium bornimense]|uniref:tRNA 4-thiouridine(8) synthase ThiI n=1 Tax=Clostridium bornimense TaxID=1216932 RepID=UPI001C1059A1|nr:tRNA 4-thiouridine(8) synthase ThiI [Clostridium bornimense]MBU5314958.1 tRNA 4-thiouridine(8) synthase ThiI [Clostridium bornimense]
MTRALAMLSGGLDSILAAKLIKDQGIEVIGITYKSYFFNEENARRMVKQIDIPLEVVDFSDEHFELVKNPKHGYGKNMNPCIDCHAMMMRYSGELLKKFEADFIITGEVINQRPMSQNAGALNTVKKESGFSDKILRPLCAKLLPPTEMEESGLVDREKLMNINGRSRKVQIELAEKWNIKDYPSPAGGCKLTEPGYSKRLRDLLDNNDDITPRDMELLRYGRRFRVSKNTVIISARTKDESDLIKPILNSNDTGFVVDKYTGSMVVLVGEATEEGIKLAASIAARYSKGKDEENVTVRYGNVTKPYNGIANVKPATDKELEKYMI